MQKVVSLNLLPPIGWPMVPSVRLFLRVWKAGDRGFRRETRGSDREETQTDLDWLERLQKSLSESVSRYLSKQATFL